MISAPVQSSGLCHAAVLQSPTRRMRSTLARNALLAGYARLWSPLRRNKRQRRGLNRSTPAAEESSCPASTDVDIPIGNLEIIYNINSDLQILVKTIN